MLAVERGGGEVGEGGGEGVGEHCRQGIDYEIQVIFTVKIK